MVARDSTDENALIKWSPTLFLIGGILTVGHAMIMGLKAFTEIATPPEVFAPAAQIFVFGGLLGVYFSLGDRSSMLVRLGGICVALGLVGFTAITVGNLLEFSGIAPPQWFVVFTLAGIVGMVPGFAAFGVVCIRETAKSRTVGLLLFAPALLFLALIASVGLLGSSPIAGLAVGTGLALIYLAIGYALGPQGAAIRDRRAVGEVIAS